MVKVGLLGTGYWGKNHLKSLKKLRDQGEVDSIVVCDANENIIKEIEKYDEVSTTTNWKDLLKDGKLDMVSIVTPSPLHYSMTKEFLLAGKDVLVEKPMAMTIEECDDLISTSEKTGSGVMVGHIFRFHPGVLEIKQRIDKGEFGDILYINVRRQTLTTPRKDMGVMLALGIHEVDLNCFLLGDQDPDYIFADMNYYFDNQEETALIIQKFGKTTAYSFESWVDPSKGKLRELQLVGSLGSASLNFSVPNKIILHQSYLKKIEEEGKKRFDVVSGGEFEVSVDFKEPLLEEIRHFVKESQNEKKYNANAFIGKRAVQLIHKAIESNERKALVKYK